MSTINRFNEILQYLNEDLYKKEPIGKGKDHYVYDFKNNPDKVIKVAWGVEGDNPFDPNAKEKQTNLNPNHVKVFKQFPEIFPKVYKFNEKYAIIEKLETEQVKKDSSELYQLITKHFENFQATERNIIDRLAFEYSNSIEYYDEDEGDRFQEMVNVLKQNNENLETFFRYVNLFEEIQNKVKPFVKDNWNPEFEKFPTGGNVDLNSNNFGYTKDGKLKLLDF
jgi:hypothetical protein